MPAPDSTQRFSSRVEKYARYRPSYPPEVIQLLQRECALKPASVVADIASGTGIFTRLLLEAGCKVFGVEPNPDMRKAGEEFLARFPNFTSVAGSAETTTLPDCSADLATAAQAAHWFDLKKARHEFARILKPHGWAVLLWNERCVDTTPFLRDYEQLLLTYGTDYRDVRHERTTANIQEFFAPSSFHPREFAYHQACDYVGLEGRLLSSFYTPAPDDPNHGPMLEALRRIFDQHQSQGQVTLEYITRVYYGQLT
jgi:SAM-dependent methyltransferase